MGEVGGKGEWSGLGVRKVGWAGIKGESAGEAGVLGGGQRRAGGQSRIGGPGDTTQPRQESKESRG